MDKCPVKTIFPNRSWTQQEEKEFEDFVRANAPNLNRIFKKYKVMTINFG